MESELSLEFLRVVEQAAIASAHTMGLGDRHKADEEAVKAMRATIVPSIPTVSMVDRMAFTASSSALWRSPKPIVLAEAIAACSTTRKNSRLSCASI